MLSKELTQSNVGARFSSQQLRQESHQQGFSPSSHSPEHSDEACHQTPIPSVSSVGRGRDLTLGSQGAVRVVQF